MMTGGDPIGADEALATGLIDEIVTGDLADRALAYAEQVVAEGRPLKKVRESNDELDALKGKPGIFDAFRKGIARKTRGFLAPEAIVQCVEAAVNKPFDEAIRRSRPPNATASSPSGRPTRFPTCPRTRPSFRSTGSASSAPAPWAAASR